jgi:SpoIID/LytB domain protein
VARVIAGEAARSSAPAALEALAIAVRTFAVANLGRHRADGFDVCDQTHCQVIRDATPATQRAAQATAGSLLLTHGTIASIYYTASCGGRTERPSDVWPGADDPPYLPAADDDACERAPAWSAELAGDDLLRALRAAGFRGSRLRDMRVTARTASGRVARLQLDGLQPATISGQDLRVAVGRAIGWQHIKSTAFDLRRRGDTYRLDGHGSGHGVGLCVIGSARLAERGRSAADILARYFPGLAISGRAGASTTLARSPALASRPEAASSARPLPDVDGGMRRAIERQAMAARDELAKTLGLPAAPIALRLHTTTDAFERATGRPWFASGAAVNGELHLAPVGALYARGILDQTIRRAVVHFLIDGVLGDRPAWVRDGAALYYSDPARTDAPEIRGSCPSDNELLQPVSVGALSMAWARARACFARQIAAGRSWRDVR